MLQHGQFVDQFEILLHGVDASLLRLGHGVEREWLVLEDNPALGGEVGAAEQLEERGLARAALAHHTQHLTRLEGEGHIQQGGHRSEVLAEIFDG